MYDVTAGGQRVTGSLPVSVVARRLRSFSIAREIVRILKALPSVLAATECQAVMPTNGKHFVCVDRA